MIQAENLVLYQELAEADQAECRVADSQSVQRVHRDYLVAPAAEAGVLPILEALEMLAVFLPQKVKTAQTWAAAEDTQELE
tara:strand:+ start:212 stop:454 length:243 start_codon:yes stop_codon:yes gene_type:complete